MGWALNKIQIKNAMQKFQKKEKKRKEKEIGKKNKNDGVLCILDKAKKKNEN
jgi:hypothetical protein